MTQLPRWLAQGNFFRRNVKDKVTGILESRVHPNDEMYQFFTTHPAHRDRPLQSYFESGEGMAHQLLAIFKTLDIKVSKIKSFLEFACGYGRFTRHLVRIIPPSKITTSDIYTEAVDFQKEVFGVHGFYSTFNPDELVIPGKYNVIFVASLFSHLPEKTWQPWLNKLYGALKKKGILIFSTHGVSCMENPAQMTETGFYYAPMSESNTLSLQDYATTYVTPEFVRGAMLKETGQPVLLEIPKGLWNYQDIYVVKKM